MNINDFLPDKVCINLDRRPERWKKVQFQFALHDLKSVRRFPALDGVTLEVPPGWEGSPGAYGCLQSHLAVVREARDNGLARIWILEDDVVLDSDFNDKFSRYAEQVPSDWDMLFFGGLHLFVRPQRISDNISRLAHSFSTFAYALRQTVYDSFIEINSRSLMPVDLNNVVLQQNFNCYCFAPPLAWVAENYSDTQNKFLYPWYLKEGLVIASPELERIQKQSVVILAHRDCTPDRSQTRNLHFKLDYYSKWYPHVSLLVVEHDQRPSLDPQTLREGVQYEFLQDGSGFNPARCFQLGFELFESRKEFFVFSESDIHLDRENIVANLELCLRYDFVSSFRHLIDLSEEDTRRLIEGKEIDLSAYGRRERSDICSGSCIFTRKGLQRIGGWTDANEATKDETQSRRVRRMLSVFESPNRALRLSQTQFNPR
ncbi:MAG TPA: glycosyltransferase family 25 protein [Pyrinomonadaceae bacterium]|nr:glycosyltransferase family 25 protein [Pyrinomonadaceae bacterium]